MKLNEITYDQLIDFMIEAIAELRRKAYKEGYEQGRFDERMESGFKAVGKKVDEMGALKALGMDFFKKSPQKERDRIVEQAKRDVEEFIYELPMETVYNFVDFVVNKEKRTVVALLRKLKNGKVLGKGIAKCHPNDCFNVHIGKAIALRRALGLEVPSEYLNAPQPTEKRIGDIVEYKGYKVEVCGYSDNRYMDYTRGTCQLGSIVSNEGKIIDDSRDE